MICHELTRVKNAFEVARLPAYQCFAVGGYLTEGSHFNAIHQKEVLVLVLVLVDLIIVGYCHRRVFS